jgi:hypothetical protein
LTNMGVKTIFHLFSEALYTPRHAPLSGRRGSVFKESSATGPEPYRAALNFHGTVM